MDSKLYHVTFDFRYYRPDKTGQDNDHTTKVVTLLVTPDLDEAITKGNEALEALPKAYVCKNRFSLRGGPYGTMQNLVSAWSRKGLKIDLYAKIETLHLTSVLEAANEALSDSERATKIYHARD